MNRVKFMVLLFSAGYFCSCTGMQNISQEDPLFIGNEYEVPGASWEAKTANLRADSRIKPKPNNKFLWMRPAVARNNMLSDSAKKKNFWKNKVDDPVLLSQTDPILAANTLQNRIFHFGYFHNSVKFDTVRLGKKRAKYKFTITLRDPFKLGTITYPDPTDDLLAKIGLSMDNTLLKTGDLYSLETIQNERIRIDKFLKDQGYLYFNPEFLFLQADSVSDDHVVNVRILVKPDTPPESKTPYNIGEIIIHDGYGLENYAPDTTEQVPFYLLSQTNDLKFEALKRGIFLEPGELYSQTKLSQSVRYLNNLPIIRATTIRFAPNTEERTLKTMVYLSKRKRYAYSAEFNTIFRSTNYFGPGFVFSYTNRNAKNGAEQLKINLRGRFEVQVAEGSVNPAYELGLELNYQLPRFQPAFLGKFEKTSLPKTAISVGYNLFNRLDLYRLNSFFLDFGYRWSENDIISHKLNPIEFIFTQIPESSKSDAFREYLEENPGVKRSFEEQFITGVSYELTYDAPSKGKSDFFLRTGVDLAGNLMYGISSAFNVEKDSTGRFSPFGVPFSHYIRTRLDIRYGYKITANTSLVTRFITGIGVPYGNSDVIPYIRQFYVGGTNSLRSFLARSVGPGSEVPPEGFRDLTGDIRLEWNLEYRFTVAGNFKSAIFLDVGNVWLYNEDETRPNGAFRFDTFIDDLAVSTGWGLRWDFDFVVARLDFAYTLRTPYLPKGEKWATRLDFWKPTFNIAVGYPF